MNLLALLLFASVCCYSYCDESLDTVKAAPPPPPPNVVVIVGYNQKKDDNYRRFLASAKANKIKPIMIKPLNPQIHRNVLRKTIETLPDKSLILYSATPDFIFADKLDVIVQRFMDTSTSLLFSGDNNCSESEYAEKFGEVVGNGLRYLSSQMIMGYIGPLRSLLQAQESSLDESDERFFIREFLTRDDLTMKIDHFCEVFQWITGSDTEIHHDKDTNSYKILNNVYWTEAPILIAKGAIGSVLLNRYTDYLNNGQESINVQELTSFPMITMAVFIHRRTPFIWKFYSNILQQDYPKDKINLVVINTVNSHQILAERLEKAKSQYASFKYLDVNLTFADILELGLKEAKELNNEFYFALDSSVSLDSASVISSLMSLNKTVVAPMLKHSNDMWTNFWGELSETGFYKRSFDFLDLINKRIQGVWNVPYISSVYLIHNSVLDKISYRFTEPWYALGAEFQNDVEITFCNNLRREGVHMFVSNLDNYGHLINNAGEPSMEVSDELFEFYEIERNPQDWEVLYMQPAYFKYLARNLTAEQPCQDVFRFAIVTERFCDDLIKIMEGYGKWSSGSHEDERLSTGYENVPTRDIHLWQVGLKSHWDFFLDRYIKPLQRQVYLGYNSEVSLLI